MASKKEFDEQVRFFEQNRVRLKKRMDGVECNGRKFNLLFFQPQNDADFARFGMMQIDPLAFALAHHMISAFVYVIPA